ncbi:MAG: S1 RNA-binding domain-containing protein, partial [Patescibacteria group bacterium]
MKKNLNLINNQLKVGNTIEGKVIKIGKNEIWVDLLDGKATGIIRGRELENELEENKNLKLGEKIKATI